MKPVSIEDRVKGGLYGRRSLITGRSITGHVRGLNGPGPL